MDVKRQMVELGEWGGGEFDDRISRHGLLVHISCDLVFPPLFVRFFRPSFLLFFLPPDLVLFYSILFHSIPFHSIPSFLLFIRSLLHFPASLMCCLVSSSFSHHIATNWSPSPFCVILIFKKNKKTDLGYFEQPRRADERCCGASALCSPGGT